MDIYIYIWVRPINVLVGNDNIRNISTGGWKSIVHHMLRRL